MSDKKETVKKPAAKKPAATKTTAKEKSKLDIAKELNPKAKEVVQVGSTIIIKN